MIRRYELPYPPSVNHYWRRVGNRTLISKEGRQYRTLVDHRIFYDYGAEDPMEGPLSMRVQVFPPDRRERDLGNLDKALSDALEYAKVFVKDQQIDHLEYTRREVVPGGKVIVELEPFGSAIQAKATGRAPDRPRGHHRSPMAARKEQR